MPRTSDLHLRINGRAVVLTSARRPQRENEYFLCPPVSGGEVRVETLKGMFSADAVCAAAFSVANAREIKERCVVMTECSGAAGIVPVVVETDALKATAVLPVPNVEKKRDSLFVSFPGVTCVVSRRDGMPESSDFPALLVLRDSTCEKILSWFQASPEEMPTELSSSGLAAAASAIDLAWSMPDGVAEYGVGMSGGTAEVGVSMRGGLLAGLSICSSVSLEENK